MVQFTNTTLFRSLTIYGVVCEENVKVKPTRYDSGFITYSNKIYFSDIWLDNSDYLITQWKKWKNTLPHGSKIGLNKNSHQSWRN